MPSEFKKTTKLPDNCSEAAQDLFKFLNQSGTNPFEGSVWANAEDMLADYVRWGTISEEEANMILVSVTLNMAEGELDGNQTPAKPTGRPLPGSWT